jgi:hypothetical protein
VKVGDWLAWLSGAQGEILQKAPGDVPKHTSMGGVLVGTAAIAAMSAAFALNTAVNLPIVPAVLVGLLWGMLILNLDRMLVVSMTRRTGVVQNVATALPRVLLALLIGAVISVPLVLRIFQPEIDNELQVTHAENLIANQKKLNEQFADIKPTQDKVDRLQAIASGQTQPGVNTDPDVQAAQTSVTAAQTAYDNAAANAQCELVGSCGTHTPGTGEAWRRAQALADQALGTLTAAKTKLTLAETAARERISASVASNRQAAQEELKTLGPALQKRKNDRFTAQQRLDSSEENNTGLLARLEALDRLSAGRPMVQLAHWTLMLLFVCIELLPVLVKLLSSTGPKTLYEMLVERREADVLDTDRFRSDQQREIADIQADAHIQLERDLADAQVEAGKRANGTLVTKQEIADIRAGVRIQLERDRADAQVEAGKRANGTLVAKQQEIADRAIEVWAEVAKRRADDELARWYTEHSRFTAPTSTPPTAQPVSVTPPTVPQQRAADPAAQLLATSVATDPSASPTPAVSQSSTPPHTTGQTHQSNGHLPGPLPLPPTPPT